MGFGKGECGLNINFHYFVMKTLCRAAGFTEPQAQTIAYYSQQVDDFVTDVPVVVETEPPEYLRRHRYAGRLTGRLWMVMPHPTGIDMLQSLGKKYRHTTLAAFHFIPPQAIASLDGQEEARGIYRCVAGNESAAVLIHQIVEDSVLRMQQNQKRKEDRTPGSPVDREEEVCLMQLGMALHTYADTYAHCGFSGLEGWENQALIENVWNQTTQKEEIPWAEREIFHRLPPIGHGNAGTAPDLCVCTIDLRMRRDWKDADLSLHIARDNRQWFMLCARKILDILCDCLGASHWEDAAWKSLEERMLSVMQGPEADKSNKELLTARWSRAFPDIIYSYEKNQRFYYGADTVSAELDGCLIRHVTAAFFDYQVLAYERAAFVTGATGALQERSGLLAESLRMMQNSSGG